MKSKFIQLASGLVAGMVCVISCVEINEELGKEYIPTKHMYDVYTDTVFLKDIKLKNADTLSGYSSSRITIGAIRDDEFGLTTRGSAFTLIPVDPDMDFGKEPECTQFHFTAIKDTLSYPDESQAHIIQNIYVYQLDKNLGEDAIYADGKNEKGEDAVIKRKRIAPVFSYFGQDSLSFDFDTDFGDEYITAIRERAAAEKLDSVNHYTENASLYGIYIETSAPTGNGGRINMFDLPIQVTDSYYIGGNYAELKFRAYYDYSDEPVDTSFLFFFGAQDMSVYQESQSSYATPTQTPQYALNISGSGTSDQSWQPVETDRLYIEGGSGRKPVISAKEIQESLAEIFAGKGINPEGVIIHKASVILPYDFDVANYEKMYLYPDRLSPTCCITSTDEETDETQYSFAGLTDSSVSTENQGDINRSLNCYCPDISHHVQEILKLTDEDNYSDYDIWMLAMAQEIVESSSSSSSSLNDYYQNLAYYDYYNSLYNPYGYGGYYGGYYGYGYDSYYGMSNYYNYMLAAQYASSQSASTATTSIQLDKDRYYRGVLRGVKPDMGTVTGKEDLNYPRMVVTYSVSKTME